MAFPALTDLCPAGEGAPLANFLGMIEDLFALRSCFEETAAAGGLGDPGGRKEDGEDVLSLGHR